MAIIGDTSNQNQKESDKMINPELNQNNDTTGDIVTDVVKKKRGSKPASIEASLTATKPEMQAMLSNVLYWYKQPTVQTDDECADRLNQFFDRIAQTGEIPTVEKMCLALGAVRSTVWEWENGSKGRVRANIIKRAKEILAALDAELVSNNKIPQVTYIFRAKNFYSMADKTEVVLTPTNPLDGNDPDQTRSRYLQALPEVTESTD